MSQVKVLTSCKCSKKCKSKCLKLSNLMNASNITSTTVVTAPDDFVLVPSMSLNASGNYAHINYSATVQGTDVEAGDTVIHRIMVNGTEVARFTDEFTDPSVPRSVSYAYTYTGPTALATVTVEWESTNGTIATLAGNNRTLSVLSWM